MGHTKGRDIAIRRKFQLPLMVLYFDLVLMPDGMQPTTFKETKSLVLVA